MLIRRCELPRRHEAGGLSLISSLVQWQKVLHYKTAKAIPHENCACRFGRGASCVASDSIWLAIASLSFRAGHLLRFRLPRQTVLYRCRFGSVVPLHCLARMRAGFRSLFSQVMGGLYQSRCIFGPFFVRHIGRCLMCYSFSLMRALFKVAWKAVWTRDALPMIQSASNLRTESSF